ncbi:hypothetical protein [Micromonospora chersina]|uniref:hypothetical protein n=1 Tax=Micromonospora chersina TaxID=47854 RepID=UPI0037102BC7
MTDTPAGPKTRVGKLVLRGGPSFSAVNTGESRTFAADMGGQGADERRGIRTDRRW